MDKTHDSNLRSWVNVDKDSDFPIQNIPFGVCSPKDGGDLHVVTAIGDFIIDLAHLDNAGVFEGTEIEGADIFHEPTLNEAMSDFGYQLYAVIVTYEFIPFVLFSSSASLSALALASLAFFFFFSASSQAL